MASSRHERISELFLDACELDPEARGAFLDKTCGEDVELRAEVEALLRQDERASGAGAGADLERAVRELLPEALSDTGGGDHPASVGPYRILKLLGEGGMGVVYLAEQREPLRRRVALKLIKVGIETRRVIQRFETERQALALMDHPNIARVYDAGATAEGRPYFAMEYIEGIPIVEYCNRNRLGHRECLELLLQVCAGVQHAHQKGIIHRDLKPSNVLVGTWDGRPVPKIIDFGIAKATADRMMDRTESTELGQLIGTPEYMSPEQAELGGLDLDTRTDVYSLGLLLYLLLAGVLPIDPEELRSTSLDEVRRRIREEVPPRPSARVESSRSGDPRRVDRAFTVRELRGELDWIVMKALEKERGRRYQSASELAADIRRYLANEPVTAGPPSSLYRCGKFVRRHVAGVSFAAALSILLIGFTVLMTVQARRIAMERDRANQEAEAASQVAGFLENVFDLSDPGEARGSTITAREILDRGAERVERELGDQPLVQARLKASIGRVYVGLGLYNRSRPLLEKALEIRLGELGEEHLDVAASRHDLCLLLQLLGAVGAAQPLCERALEVRERLLGPNHPDVAWSLTRVAAGHHAAGELTEARTFYERALAIHKRASGPEQPPIAYVVNALGHLDFLEGDLDGARTMYERALRVQRETLGDDHPRVAWTLRSLADLQRHTGKLEQARRLYREALAVQRSSLGPEHPEVSNTLWGLVRVHLEQGRPAEAESLIEQILEIKTKVFGEPSRELAYDRACWHALLGDRDNAIRYLRRAAELGYADAGWMARDEDLRSLHGDVEFEEILAGLRERKGGK